MKIVSIIRDSFIECAPFTWGISLFSFGCNLKCDFCKGYNYETVTNEMFCKNPRCITSVEQDIKHIFKLTDKATNTYRCIYCDTKNS